MSRRFNFTAGELLLIDKPIGWTSFDVVSKIRNTLKPLKIKVGHAGTLDPLATGLLIVCTGKLTKSIETLQAHSKTYTGTFCLGATTPSFDLETEIDARFDYSNITSEMVHACTNNFLGAIEQIPPLHSAIRQNGERLYQKARRGEFVEVKKRAVEIYNFEITAVDLPDVAFCVSCSKGTYIRSLAADVGKALNNGAYLSKLCRTQIGDFSLSDARSVTDWVELIRSLKQLPDFQ